MRKILNLSLGISLAILFVGCGRTYTNVPYLKPAQISKMKSNEVIATTMFKNDNIGLGSKVEANLVSARVSNKPYFKVVNRSSIDQAIKEQGLQRTKYLNRSKAVKIGKILGATKIIVGNIASSDVEKDQYSYTKRYCESYYSDGSCASTYTKRFYCDTNKGTLSATINLIDVKTGLNIHAENVTRELNSDSCKGKFLTKQQTLTKMADIVARDFVDKLIPRRVNNYVQLKDKIKNIEIDDRDKEIMKNSLLYLKQGRPEKAKKLLLKLNAKLNGQSYEVIYNLAITEQAMGNLEKSKELLLKADDLCLEPDAALNHAIKNIDNIIAQEKAAKKQI